jgi:hypothetical protein
MAGRYELRPAGGNRISIAVSSAPARARAGAPFFGHDAPHGQRSRKGVDTVQIKCIIYTYACACWRAAAGIARREPLDAAAHRPSSVSMLLLHRTAEQRSPSQGQKISCTAAPVVHYCSCFVKQYGSPKSRDARLSGAPSSSLCAPRACCAPCAGR